LLEHIEVLYVQPCNCALPGYFTGRTEGNGFFADRIARLHSSSVLLNEL